MLDSLTAITTSCDLFSGVSWIEQDPGGNEPLVLPVHHNPYDIF